MSNSNVVRYDGAPLFMGVLEIARRGQPVETSASTLAMLNTAPSARSVAPALDTVSAAPLPGVWGRSAACRDAPEARRGRSSDRSHCSQVSLRARTSPGRKTQLLAGSRFLWDAPADIVLTFGAHHGLQRIESIFTFLRRRDHSYEAVRGADGQADVTRGGKHGYVGIQRPEAALSITLTETQGTMRAIYEISENKCYQR